MVDESGNVLPEALRIFNNTLKKYNSGAYITSIPGLEEKLQKRQTAVPLTDQCSEGEGVGNDILYYGSMNVRGKPFTIQFDTGSSDFFLPGPKCTSAQGCPGTSRYDEGGKDLGNTTTVTYGSGAIKGENFLDTVTVGNLSATNVNIISLTNAEGFNSSESDGLMGMAFSTLANSRQPTFVEQLIAEKKIPSKEFCYHLGRCSTGTHAQSELSIGSHNPAKYTGNLLTVPVVSKDYWRVAVDGYQVNSAAVPISAQAAIDTGTTAIIASTAYAAPIGEALGGIPLQLGGSANFPIIAYAFPCANAQNTTISFTFAGEPLAIHPNDLVLGTIELGFAELLNIAPLTARVKAAQADPAQTLCVGSVLQADIGLTMDPPVTNFHIIGDTFLKNWYSCYSYDAVDGKPAVLFGKSV
ncbi:acid protease [Polyplosphaeria fusca]|uniref:Acid protease n=1 Tax=Polyplosphaeria fusca TaxID=682080 RepID=A0A9P4V470_9PLEO|nr:acid protease [Polyplosphaeria fusca]